MTPTAADRLTTVLEVFQRWLYLPDTDPVVVVLAAVAANRQPGDAAWLQLVGPPGGGKTEIIQSVLGLPEVRAAATLTKAALLSGVPRKERVDGSKGGLLREIGEYGIVTMKDFGSILSMNRDHRGELLAALREIYDGSWTRPVGADGGITLSWKGKVGLIAGVTPAIDEHHAVMAALGERFCFYRMTVDDPAAQTHAALSHFQQEDPMRNALRAAVAALFEHVPIGQRMELSKEDLARLVPLAEFVVRCRSAVIRDRYSRDIELVPAGEAPARFGGVLARLLTGARMIGADEETAWRITTKAALDSMPSPRLAAITFLRRVDTRVETAEAATDLGLPTTTTRRVLEDLTAHGVITRSANGKGRADEWGLSGWSLARVSVMGVSATSTPPNGHSQIQEVPISRDVTPASEMNPAPSPPPYIETPYGVNFAGKPPHIYEGGNEAGKVPPTQPESPPALDGEEAWTAYGEDDIPF